MEMLDLKDTRSLHVPFHYEEDFYKYSRNLCQNYIVITVLAFLNN